MARAVEEERRHDGLTLLLSKGKISISCQVCPPPRQLSRQFLHHCVVRDQSRDQYPGKYLTRSTIKPGKICLVVKYPGIIDGKGFGFQLAQ